MMKRYNYILLFLFLLMGTISCEDDLGVGNSQEEGITEGMVTIHLTREPASEIITRANECTDCNDQEAIENVMLMIFKPKDNSTSPTTDADYVLENMAYQELIEDNNSVSIYMANDEGQKLYALCNLPEEKVQALQNATKGSYTIAQLKEEAIEIAQVDGAYTGKYVMTGETDIVLVNGVLNREGYNVCVKRLAAQLVFNIATDLPDGDQFLIGGIYLHNIPKGSRLIEAEQTSEYDGCTEDYVSDAKEDNADEYYFNLRVDNDDKEYDGSEGLWLDYSEGTNGYEASFQIFENRRGQVEDKKENWPRLAGFTDEEYKYYQQVEKRGLAKTFERTSDVYSADKGKKGFLYATYLTIHGVYQHSDGLAENVTYFVYLGGDNYKDFNIRRNHLYYYNITIKDADHTDTRVLWNYLNQVTLYYNKEKILDAHPDMMQVLLFSPNEWTVRVENPDETPWIEVSKAASYIPNLAGVGNPDAATFSIKGNGGMHYFYVYVDEFVPAMEAPALLSPDTRTGTIICESGDVKEEIEIKQYAAQQVVCHIKYDIHTMKEIRDTFYVERVLEQKNLSWGFDHYWSLITDDLIAAGQWDGLANTRRLYEAATQGDKYDIESAYPDGIPSDIALGYAINKNRDRNGDGKITYDEIVWYLPAANEMQAVYGHNKVSLEDAGDYYMDAENIGKIVLDPDVTGNFHTSSPSVADPAGITPGRSYYVDMSSGKKAIGLRSRRYNVLCARRKPGFFGNPNENTGIGGSVGNNPNWNEDEEQIMDKNN